MHEHIKQIGNNTVAEIDTTKQLRERLRRNAQEREMLLAKLDELDPKPRRKARGVFTKTLLAKVEERFPSRPRPRQHRRQKR